MNHSNAARTPAAHAPDSNDRVSGIFADIHRLASARLEELLAVRCEPDSIGGVPLSMARSFEFLVNRARIEEVHHLAQRIAVLAFERYGQALVLAEDLDALAERHRRAP